MATGFDCKAFETVSIEIPVGKPVRLSTSGIIQIGVKFASMSALARERCAARVTATFAPGLAIANINA